MKGEILDIETAKKLARLDKVIKYIDETIKKEKLFAETIKELKTINKMLKGSDK